MLGDSSSVLATTTTTPAAAAGGGGAGGGNGEAPPSAGGHHEGSSNDIGGEEDRRIIEGDRSFGGNRWPRQETLALLKIRSDMDVAFRDASVKGPLWDEVSRKLAQLGYNRSAKKCKEKFENVYKYHKRTKDGRSGKQEGKTYRFFDQLEAFESHPPPPLTSPVPLLPPPPKHPQTAAVITTIAMPVVTPPSSVAGASHSTVPSITATATLATNISQGINVTSAINLTVPPSPSTNPTILPPSQATPQTTIPSSFPNFSSDLISNSTSSSTSSDVVELQGRRRKRKRKWKDFFERLMKEVIRKQEEMQKKFLEAIERREHDRMVREESWRMQEMTRINREREILAQERSIAATNDAAVMAFLQKLSEQQSPGQVQNNPPPSQPQPPPPPAPPPVSQPTPTPTPTPPQPLPVALVQQPQPQPVSNLAVVQSDNGDPNFMSAGSSRWPKVEVEALIRLRTNLDCKYQENGPKGPLWEEISAGMRKLGYNRNAKRCKEKWENINKYFKKVKESNKKRPEDSKTCPYFHQLDALYKEKNKIDGPSSNSSHMKPENSLPLMVRPEQQWRPPQQQEHRPDSVMEDLESDDHQNHDEEDDKDIDDEEEDDEGSHGYEIVASKQTSMNTCE